MKVAARPAARPTARAAPVAAGGPLLAPLARAPARQCRPLGVPAAAAGSGAAPRSSNDDKTTPAPPPRAAALEAAAAPASSAAAADIGGGDPAVVAKLRSAKAGSVVQLYRSPGLTASAAATLLRRARAKGCPSLARVEGEAVYNVQVAEPLTEAEARTLAWLLRETYEPELLGAEPALGGGSGASAAVVEVGPRMSFSTAFSTNATGICASCGLGSKVPRLERSRRYALHAEGGGALAEAERAAFASLVHDRMTEEVYGAPVASFAVDAVPAPVFSVPVMADGRAALEKVNDEMGLAFDDWDLDYYTNLFREDMKRDPTNVELFDIAQSNSEHSRHWFFRGDVVVDGAKQDATLMQVVKAPLKAHPGNSVVAFKDNSSAIRGFEVNPLLPANPGGPGPLAPRHVDYDLLLTAETHNFPCAVAPYPGAETGAGGRIRDTHATGTGSLMGASTAGYCVGNLMLDSSLPGGGPLPGEDPSEPYPPSLAPPQQILIDASNGASDYGNKFGEPLVCGYTRTFGMRVPAPEGGSATGSTSAKGDRREWLKPIMFSGGLGQIDHRHLHKADGELGMLVVKIGGPAYRIGMGGGAASSVPSGSTGDRGDLDFNAVQRGDAEMAQKLWRVVRACVELGSGNPLVQIHDQGAGGNCNVVKEIVYPLGGTVDVRSVAVGDATLSVLEIWGAEYQENDCLLIKPEDRPKLEAVCARERCIMQVIGSIDGSGRIRLVDGNAPETPPAVDLDLEKVLGSMPNKTFSFDTLKRPLKALELPAGLAAQDALEKVLRLPSVCSKRFLTTKVDRHVTGLIAQQQCCGPLQIPVADVAVMAQSHQDLSGAATAIGEQPIKGLLDPAAMARLSLGEALTNLCFARATDLADVKASVNWMYAAKMGDEGAAMYKAACALRDAMIELRVACDGGKDSLSMAAAAGGETVMAPGNLVVSAYVGCPDVTKVVTPDLVPGKDGGVLLHVDLGRGRRRLGGSALAQAHGQLGDESPDVTAADLGAAWRGVQAAIDARLVRAGHDISDGGIVTALLEMAFAGNCGLSVDLPAAEHAADARYGALAPLFAEELGLLLEVAPADVATVTSLFSQAGAPCAVIGRSRAERTCEIKVGGQAVVEGKTAALRDQWEATAFALERLQAAEECVAAEQAAQAARRAPQWRIPYPLQFTPKDKLNAGAQRVKVAVVREEGSNGDREMSAAVYAAGMEPWDVTMSDLIDGRVSLSTFRGVVFVGGFSYADVLDSAKGWAGTIRFNARVLEQFRAFYDRPDTFSLGVCNGCQLMALLGWVPATVGGGEEGSKGSKGDKAAAPPSTTASQLPDGRQPRFVHNASGRFESRWAQVSIAADTPAVMLKGMGGASIGVWCAHGEGQALFPDESVKKRVLSAGLAPIRYVDPSTGKPTEAYPSNPNGSPEGVAALCSADGRHLAMMPHPERCFLAWQLPWSPPDLGLDPYGPGPWLRLFQNAREWAEKTPAGAAKKGAR